METHPRVGLGIVIVNKDGRVLVGKRKGGHAQKYSIPGGHLEMGETFEQAAIREAKEETNLDIFEPKLICVINDLETYSEEGKHYVSAGLLATKYSGELKVMEPEKCESWSWVDPKNLPEPHFDASRMEVKCYLNGSFYEVVK
ncbi:MAG: NUDIX domain-containing protein [Candidatus Nomurabacteria bacterium]|nr:NUDIX domain-containing protein [Candidatus Nomurabacteria bacterium]